MNRIAVVTQRCHPSVVGGSETLAWQYANLLKNDYDVEVLTTTAIRTNDWANELPAGDESIDGVLIRRFSVTLGRLRHWGGIYERLLADFRISNGELAPGNGARRWPIALQREFVRTQGPYSEPLIKFLREKWSNYETIIFVTYLYPTSYFGMLEVPRDFALFVPTLHDEEPAQLSIYKHAASRSRSLIWLTAAEQKLGHRLWGALPGRVVGMKVDTDLRSPAKPTMPYLLYCGRIDPNKGCPGLFEYFIKFKQEYPSDIQLVLAGKDDIPVPEHDGIRYRGFVPTEEKFSLMAGATALVMPSARESFSIVTLEAMAQETPVIANEASDVVAEHVRQSKGGELYGNYETFAAKLKELMSYGDKARQLGASGRRYVLENYQPERIRQALIEVIETGRQAGFDTRAT